MNEGPKSLNFFLPRDSIGCKSNKNSHTLKDDVLSLAKKSKQLKSRNLGSSSTAENIYHSQSFNESNANKSLGIFPSVVSKIKVTNIKNDTIKPKN